MPREKFAWASLSDEELLEVRLKDLKVTVEGTWLEDCLLALHDELAQSGIGARPHAWISSEWFSPENAPGIAIPFYLAHPRLMRLERKMIIDVEGGTWAECMAILRHEAGHVVQHAYALSRRRHRRARAGNSPPGLRTVGVAWLGHRRSCEPGWQPAPDKARQPNVCVDDCDRRRFDDRAAYAASYQRSRWRAGNDDPACLITAEYNSGGQHDERTSHVVRGWRTDTG